MKQKLEQNNIGLGNGTYNEGYFPTAKQECIWGIPEDCIWDIPEDKRHCEFCTANCINAHAVSTPTELEQAAVEYQLKTRGRPNVIGGDDVLSEEEYMVFNSNRDFKAGAEWQKKQDELTWQGVKAIVSIAENLEYTHGLDNRWKTEQKFYEEVLKEFNNLKNKEI